MMKRQTFRKDPGRGTGGGNRRFITLLEGGGGGGMRGNQIFLEEMNCRGCNPER